MKISEIELINDQHFPEEVVKKWLDKSRPRGTLENFIINYVEFKDQRGIILTDTSNKIAAYAGFIARLNGKIWQSQNAMSYEPYKGNQLVGKIYKTIKEGWGISLQSDTQQSIDGMKLWTKTLPSLGLRPMIFDSDTDRIIDPTETKIDMYPSDNSNQRRYSWILESSDYYPTQNLLAEDSLLMPYVGLWYKK
jgi:hypothetical protein